MVAYYFVPCCSVTKQSYHMPGRSQAKISSNYFRRHRATAAMIARAEMPSTSNAGPECSPVKPGTGPVRISAREGPGEAIAGGLICPGHGAAAFRPIRIFSLRFARRASFAFFLSRNVLADTSFFMLSLSLDVPGSVESPRPYPRGSYNRQRPHSR